MVTIAYAAGVVFFWNHFYPSSTLYGTDVSCKATSVEQGIIIDAVNSWSVHIHGDGVDTYVTASDIGLALSQNAPMPSLRQHAETWPFDIFGNHDMSPRVSVTTFDDARLRKAVSQIVNEANQGSTPSKDARIILDDSTGTFVIEPETVGTELDMTRVLDRAAEAAKLMRSEVELGPDDLLQPRFHSGDEALAEGLKRAGELGHCEITFTFGGTVVTHVGSDTVMRWVHDDGGHVGLSCDAIEDWVKSDVSPKLDTVGTYRHYVRADGKDIEVPAGTGSYGWRVDTKALAKAVKTSVESGQVESIEVPMAYRGETHAIGGRDWPSRYVDVDLMEQHVRLYDGDAVIWESDCVSGDVTTGHGTPLGVFFLERKASPMTLVGLDEDNDGNPDYRLDVSWWLPFYGGCGFHDASWRSAFGGGTYIGNGSHGCVNLPAGAAQELYGLLVSGDVVVVHE
jgi:hypothetical protein